MGNHASAPSGQQAGGPPQVRECLVPEPPPERIVQEMRSEAFGVAATGLRTFKGDIVGSEMVDWMTGQLWCVSRQRAIELGQLLVTAGLLQMVHHSDGFVDDVTHLYRLPKEEGEAGVPTPTDSDTAAGATHEYDLIVIGAGAAGLAAASFAAKVGARVALVEKRLPGGDNLWTTSVPSKALAHVAKTVQSIKSSSGLGIMTGPVRVDMNVVRSHVMRVQNDVFKDCNPAALAKRGIEIFHGTGAFVDASTIEIAPAEDDGIAHGTVTSRGTPASPALPGVAPSATSALAAYTRGRSWSSTARVGVGAPTPEHVLSARSVPIKPTMQALPAIGESPRPTSSIFEPSSATPDGTHLRPVERARSSFTASPADADATSPGVAGRPVIPPLQSRSLAHPEAVTGEHIGPQPSARRRPKTVRAPRVIVATGSRPIIPDIEGLESVPYFTSDNVFENGTLPRRFIVIGGGPCGCEIAQAYARLGSEVTLIAPVLLPREDASVREVLRRVFYKERILHVAAHAVKVEYEDVLSPSASSPVVPRTGSANPHGQSMSPPHRSSASSSPAATDTKVGASPRLGPVSSGASPRLGPIPPRHTSGSFSGRLSVGGLDDTLPAPIRVYAGEEIIQGDMLFIATGREPVLDGLHLDGIGLSPESLVLNDTLQSGTKHVYFAGDAAGGETFAHVAYWQGSHAARNALLPGHLPGWPDIVPRVTYVDPEVATIGLTPSEAQEKYGERVRIFTRDNEECDRAKMDGDIHGFVSLAVLKDGSIVGATIVGARASEVAAEVSFALSSKAKVQDIALAIHPYPTSSSLLHAVAMAAATEHYVQGSAAKVVHNLYRSRAASVSAAPTAGDRSSRRPSTSSAILDGLRSVVTRDRKPSVDTRNAVSPIA